MTTRGSIWFGLCLAATALHTWETRGARRLGLGSEIEMRKHSVIIAITLVMLGCAKRNMEEAVGAWITCEECEAGERSEVVRLGDEAVPLLGRFLGKGPPREDVKRQREHLQQSYREMLAHSRLTGLPAPALSEEEYVNYYLANYDRLYRERSVEALEAIGGARAEAMLMAVSRDKNVRPDVKEMALGALKRLRK